MGEFRKEILKMVGDGDMIFGKIVRDNLTGDPKMWYIEYKDGTERFWDEEKQAMDVWKLECKE